MAALGGAGIRVSLFIDPDEAQIEAARRVGSPVIELHTGAYAEATGGARAREFERLRNAAKFAASLGLTVNAGHGLNYHNVEPIAAIPEIIELNIGHAIVARAIIDGLAKAVRDMKELMCRARAASARMIFGIGIDVLKVDRVERVYQETWRALRPASVDARRAGAARAHGAPGAISRHALRGQGGHRQGHGHRLFAWRVDSRRGRRAKLVGQAGSGLFRNAAPRFATAWG